MFERPERSRFSLDSRRGGKNVLLVCRKRAALAFLLFIPTANAPAAAVAPAEENWQPWNDNSTEGWFAPEPKYDDGMTPAPWEDAFTFFRSAGRQPGLDRRQRR